MSLHRVLPMVGLLALVATGCGNAKSDADASVTATSTAPETTTSTTTTPKPPAPPKFDPQAVRRNGAITRTDRRLISAALKHIEGECVRRRTSKRKVGRPSAQFRFAVDVLIAEYRDTPLTRFRRVGRTRPTTLRANLARLDTTLGKAPPRGCGANSTRGGGVTGVRLRISKALNRG